MLCSTTVLLVTVTAETTFVHRRETAQLTHKSARQPKDSILVAAPTAMRPRFPSAAPRLARQSPVVPASKCECTLAIGEVRRGVEAVVPHSSMPHQPAEREGLRLVGCLLRLAHAAPAATPTLEMEAVRLEVVVVERHLRRGSPEQAPMRERLPDDNGRATAPL